MVDKLFHILCSTNSLKLKHANRQLPDEEDEEEEKVNVLPTSV